MKKPTSEPQPDFSAEALAVSPASLPEAYGKHRPADEYFVRDVGLAAASLVIGMDMQTGCFLADPRNEGKSTDYDSPNVVKLRYESLGVGHSSQEIICTAGYHDLATNKNEFGSVYLYEVESFISLALIGEPPAQHQCSIWLARDYTSAYLIDEAGMHRLRGEGSEETFESKRNFEDLQASDPEVFDRVALALLTASNAVEQVLNSEQARGQRFRRAARSLLRGLRL